MSAINNAGVIEHPYPVKDTLFFKIQGADEAVALTSDLVKKITQRHGSDRFEFAATDEEAADLWQSRKYALQATQAVVPGAKCWTTDVWYVASDILTGNDLDSWWIVFRLLDYHNSSPRRNWIWQNMALNQPLLGMFYFLPVTHYDIFRSDLGSRLQARWRWYEPLCLK